MPTSIKDVISKVREELVAADAERRHRGDEALLRLKNVDIEIHFTVERTDALKGGFDLKVVSLGGKEQYREEEVQTIRVTLEVASGATSQAPAGSLFSGGQRSEPDVDPLA
jgi:hypothetical protein